MRCRRRISCRDDLSQTESETDWFDRRQEVPEIVVQSAIEPASEIRKPQRGSWLAIAAGLLAIAATIVVAIVIAGAWRQPDSHRFNGRRCR